MKSNKKIVTLLAGVLIFLIVIVVVLFVGGRKESSKEDEFTGQSESISTVEQMIETEEPFTIETKYGDLYYPAKWKEQITTEIKEEDDVYTVQFFGKVEDKEAQHLFNIVFGGKEGALIGQLSIDGADIPVYIVGKEIETGEEWSDEELDTIYTMQEDVNYTIGMLQKEDGFVQEN